MALRVGIVGAGRAGRRKAHRLQMYSDVEIYAVADPERPVRDEFAARFDVKLTVSDHRRLAVDEKVDVIYVCSPPSTHSVVAIDSLAGGKHVVVEPPMALTVEQAEEMMAAAVATELRLLVALPYRYDPIIQRVCELIDEDEVGYPFLVILTCLENEFDRMNDKHDWKGTWDVGGGGILMQQGSEISDLLESLFGEIGAVNAVCTRFAIESLNKAEDSCLLGLEFMDDVSAEVAMTGAARYSTWPDGYDDRAMRMEILGLDGSIRVTDYAPRLTIVSKSTGVRIIDESDISTNLPNDMERDLLDAIIGKKEPLVTPEHGLDALRVVLAGYKASQMKRRVEILEQV